MFSAFIAIPFTYLTFKSDGVTGASATALQASMQLSGTVLFIVLTRFMKRLLNKQYSFHGTDRHIDLMIMANVGAGTLILTGLFYPPLKETLGIAAMVVMVFLGIVQIQFGFRLNRLQNDLGGVLKSFCYINVVTGVCIASVVLIPVGVVVSAVSDVMLGTIFFGEAKLVKKPDFNEIEKL